MNRNALVDYIDDIDAYIAEYGDNEASWMKMKILCGFKRPLSRFKKSVNDAKKVRWRYERIDLMRELSKTLPADELAEELGITLGNLRNQASRHNIALLPRNPRRKDDDVLQDALHSTITESYGVESLLYLAGQEARKIITSKWSGVSL